MSDQDLTGSGIAEIAVSYIQIRRFADAAEKLGDYLVRPNLPHDELLSVFSGLRNHDEVADLYGPIAAGKDTSPDQVEFARQFAKLLGKLDYQVDAAIIWKRVCASSSANPSDWWHLFFSQNRVVPMPELLETAQKLCEVDAKNPGSWFSVARNLHYNACYADAADYYARAIALRPDHGPSVSYYIECLAFAGRGDEAIRQVLGLEGDDDEKRLMMYIVATILDNRRKNDGARRAYRMLRGWKPRQEVVDALAEYFEEELEATPADADAVPPPGGRATARSIDGNRPQAGAPVARRAIRYTVADIPNILDPSVRSAFESTWPNLRDDKRFRLWTVLDEQNRVVCALILREIRTRFGRLKLGYLWALIEPALQIGLFSLLFYVGGRKQIGALSLPLFISTGLLAFYMFQTTYNRINGAIRSNLALLAHRQVKPLDVVIARSLLEGATTQCVMVVIIAIIAFSGQDVSLHDPIKGIAALLLLWLMGLGLGLLVESLSVILQSLRMVLGVGIRFLYFTSGIFFTLSMFLGDVREALLYNPVLHLVETVRYSFDPTLVVAEVNLAYPAIWTLSILFLGLASDRALRVLALSR